MNYNYGTECRGIIGLLHEVVRAYFPIVMIINTGKTISECNNGVSRNWPVELICTDNTFKLSCSDLKISSYNEIAALCRWLRTV
jgi:hypothetical protein